MKRASRGQQKGSYVRVAALLDDFIQPGWRRGGLSLVSWLGAFVVFRLIQDSLKSASEYQAVDAGEYCSNQCSNLNNHL